MMHELSRLLISASLVLTAVALLILALRAPLRRGFGAELAYLAWGALPLSLLATLLPAPRQAALPLMAPVQQLALQAAPALGPVQLPWLAALWLAGCIAMLAWFWRAHARFSPADGPALVGLLRPTIVLPADFTQRYSDQEQGLILAHERAHARRRDPLHNALCALLQCLFWFHPLMHLAARRFRQDQELACDAAVLRQHPGQRRSYAEALLKTQLATQATPIYCQWQSIHPLKERIMTLQQTAPRSTRRLFGRLAVALLVATSAWGAYASAAAQGGGDYVVDLRFSTDGQSWSPRVKVDVGVPFAVANGSWRGEFVLQSVKDKTVFLKSTFKRDGQTVGEPALMIALGQQASVAINGNFKMDVTVSNASAPPPLQ
jgi:beta-lactamase regulating signal transducer with metallopeptidase domain